MGGKVTPIIKPCKVYNRKFAPDSFDPDLRVFGSEEWFKCDFFTYFEVIC